MFLKKIEMVGFKSFADRTKIEFDQGITAIVGPNGSGKSNVTESLRWALGEQSAKSLRGAKMPDIIFAGTQNRKALNYAEVIVTFDNSDTYLNSTSEVVVTRRLYRNGDSEFLINGKKVRLKDVHELFTDTGLGKDSFSIISQGKIESIFNSKPEERRAIFEEAAGVLKYKGRKKETESKLSTTQENIDRLDDIIYELNTQLVPLKAQRDTAIKYQELDQERKNLELSVVVAQIIKEKITFEQKEEQFEQVEEDIRKLADKQRKFEEATGQIKQKKRATEFDRENLQAELLTLTQLKTDYQGKIELFDSQKSASDKSRAEREERLAKAQLQKEQLEEKLEAIRVDIDAKNIQKSDLEKVASSLDLEASNFSEDPEVMMEKLRVEYVNLVNEEANTTNELTRNKAEIESILREDKEKSESSKQLQLRYDQTKQALEEIEKEYQASKEKVDQLLLSYNECEQERELVILDLQKSQNQMFTAMDNLKNQKAKLSSLENIQANHSNFYQGVKAVLQNASQIGGIIGAVADLISFDSKYSTAMEIALGGGAQNIIVENENSARTAIDFLKKNRLGRATFLPLTTIKARELSQANYVKLQGQKGFIDVALNLVSCDQDLVRPLSSLLGTTVVVDTAENASLIAKSMNYTVKIVTLDGTILMPGGSYSGGAGKRNSTTFTTAEIENLQKSIPDLEVKLSAAEAQVKEYQEKIDSLNVQLVDIRDQGEKARFLSQEKQLKFDQLSREEEDYKIQLSYTVAGKNSLELEKLQEKNSQLEANLKDISLKKIKIDSDLNDLKANQADIKGIKEKLVNDQQEVRLKLTELMSSLKYVREEEERISLELRELASEISSLSASLNTTETLTSFDREELQVKLAEVEERVSASNQKLIQMKFELEDLIAREEDLEALNSESIKERQELSDRRTRLDLEIEQLKSYLQNKQAILTDTYHMSFQEAKEEAEEILDLVSAEFELKDLEKSIRGLGAVNIEAINQYAEVKERYDFLSRQKDDLLESKEMLLDTISDMDDEVKVRFKTTFEAIRESFKETFKQMFGGGKADLELTSDNLLEAGVEIAVQPPGKKLASLNLMSGGEKALTALALLFAILRVRTVPFVVLDEVEAALDEANVKRFGDYMTRFDGASQFIVVTHRKGTMSAADAIYGVTMQESGVSKMVSVKLKDIDEMEGSKND